MEEIKIRYTFQDGIGCNIKHKDFTLKEIESRRFLFDYWKVLARRLFTGLKDKNGKEIYEGDILESYAIIDSVCFEDGVFTTTRSERDRLGYKQPMFVHDKVEVIGNIYENSELLK